MSPQETNEGAPSEAAPVSALVQKQITGIIVSGSGPAGSTDKVMLSANSQLEYTSIKQRDPMGIVFYFPDTSFGQIKSQYTPDSDIITLVKTAMAPDQKGAKVEVVLKKDSSYEVKRSGNDMEIVFTSKTAPPLMETPIADATSKPVKSKTDSASVKEAVAKDSGKSSKSQPSSKTAASSTPSVIDRIDFLSEESGKSSVIVGTTVPANYELTKISDRTLKLRIFNSRLPEFRLQRPLITTRFQSAVDKVSPVQATDTDATDIIIDLRELTPYRPVQEENVITVYFDSSSVGPKPSEAALLPESQQALASNVPAVKAANAEPLAPVAQSKPVVQSVLEQTENTPVSAEEPLASELLPAKQYTGQKIALDFYQTDIKNVFRILQQISGKNYAVDKEVTGEVTLSCEKPVPSDQVLDLILQMNGLGKKEQGDIVRITTTARLQKEEEEIAKKLAAIRERENEKKLLDPIETEFVPINYASAEKEVAPKLQELIFGGKKGKGAQPTKEGEEVRGKIDVDGRNNQVIIHSTRNIIERCKEIIKEIDKVTPQVLIEARIIEVSDSYERQLGISWSASGEDIYRSDLNGMYSYNVAMNTPFNADASSTNTIALNFTRLDAWGTPIVLDAALKAMEQQGEGKIISSPKVLTLDNKTALIEQGTKVPYQELSSEGVPTTKFEKAVLSLEVTPHMTPDHRISMVVKTTKNEILEYSPLGSPVTSINEANTELLVDDGETVVIGGVVKTTTNKNETGLPLLKDIPLLGWLFKSVDDETKKQELLIFMTPRIVQLAQKDMAQLQ